MKYETFFKTSKPRRELVRALLADERRRVVHWTEACEESPGSRVAYVLVVVDENGKKERVGDIAIHRKTINALVEEDLLEPTETGLKFSSEHDKNEVLALINSLDGQTKITRQLLNSIAERYGIGLEFKMKPQPTNVKAVSAADTTGRYVIIATKADDKKILNVQRLSDYSLAEWEKKIKNLWQESGHP